MIKERFNELLKLKSVITILLLVTFIILTLKGVVGGNDFLVVFMMVMTFYFNKDKKENK